MNEIEVPTDVPHGAGPLGLAMHFGNLVMVEALRRQLPLDQVRQCVLWYSAVFANAQSDINVEQVVEEFRAVLEQIKSSTKRS